MRSKQEIGRKILVVLFILCLTLTSNQQVFALSDGAYVVGRTVSYANPDTGTTVDGGTNIALGESMANSIVENQALVEIVNGKTYVTIGIGLMSNVSNIRIKVKQSNGSYQQVSLTKTGTSTKDGDTCNHYRFEVPSGASRISPILYVTPMGRDVQFFIDLTMSSAKKGTGIYTSQMVTATKEPEATKAPVATTTPAVTKKPEATKTPTTATKTPTITTSPAATKEHTVSSSPSSIDSATEAPVGQSTMAPTGESTTESIIKSTIAPTLEPTVEDRIEEAEGIVLNQVGKPQEIVVERGVTVENAVAILICMVCMTAIQVILVKRGRK